MNRHRRSRVQEVCLSKGPKNITLWKEKGTRESTCLLSFMNVFGGVCGTSDVLNFALSKVGGWTYGVVKEFPALLPSLIGCALGFAALLLFIFVHKAFSNSESEEPKEPKDVFWRGWRAGNFWKIFGFWNAYPGHHWLSSICFCIIFCLARHIHLHSLGPKVDSDQCSTSASDTSLSESKSKSVIFRWPIPMILAMRFASGFATFAMYEAVPLWLISNSAVGGLSLDEKSVGSLLCRSGILKSWQVLEGLDQNGPITDKKFYEHKSMDVSGKDAEICLHLSLRYLEHLLLHLDFAPLHQAFWYSLLFRGNKHHRSSHCNPSSLLQLQFGLVTKDCPRAIFAWNLYEFIIYLVWICRIWGCWIIVTLLRQCLRWTCLSLPNVSKIVVWRRCCTDTLCVLDLRHCCGKCLASHLRIRFGFLVM